MWSPRLPEMALALLYAFLPMGSTAPAFPTSSSLDSCISRMNGQLPAYLPSDFQYSGNVRRYYVAAEEMTWEYAPTGWDNWLGVPLEDSPRAYSAGYSKAAGSLGTNWTKAVYRGYTDSTFSTKSQQAQQQGLQGPLMRAEVGDLIEILLVNELSKNYVSLHSMGLGYNKDNEGSLYPNNTSPEMAPVTVSGDAIPPGGCYTYKWVVPASSAPTNNNPSKFWAYHSYVNMPVDLNTGLMGPFIVYGRGLMNQTMAANRELVLLYNNYDESNSFLASTNNDRLGNSSTGSMPSGPTLSAGQGYGNQSIWLPQVTNMPSTTLSSTLAPSFHTLNGYIYSNLPPFQMCVDDPVIWYVYAFGMASHVFHLHGNNFLTPGGQYMASHSLNDGNMVALRMNATSRGLWDLVCHVNNHLSDGMVAGYLVMPQEQCNLPRLA